MKTPWGLITFFDMWVAPANSITRYNVAQAADDMLYTDVTRFNLDGIASIAKEAARNVPAFYKGASTAKATELKNWILQKISGIELIVDQIESHSDCVRDLNKKINQDIAAAAKDFVDALSKQGTLSWNPADWFADQARNSALLAAVAAIPIDVDSLLGGSAENVIYREQCFLLSYVGRISAYKKHVLESVVDKDSIVTKKLPYASSPFNTVEDSGKARNNNATLLIDGDPYGFINKLTQSPSYAKFFDIEPSQLSGLQPRIRLFKVIYDDNNKEQEVEMKFNSHFAKDEMDFFMSQKSRGAGVGLKNFTFTYDGSNPFAAKKSIKATLKITATSFQELFENRNGKITGLGPAQGPKPLGTGVYRYADLALKTLFKEKKNSKATKWDLILDSNANLAKLNFRLKAVVGWSSPTGGLPGTDAQEIRQAAAESFVTLNLTPTVHNFDFDEQGRVTFTINYLAYVEDFFDQRGFNAFADPSGKISLAREIRRLKMKKYSKECTDKNDDLVQEEKKKYAEIAHSEQKSSVKKIVSALSDEDKIYYLNIDNETLRSFVSHGPYGDVGSSQSFSFFGSTNTLVYNSKQQDELVKEDIEKALAPASGGTGGYRGGAKEGDELNQIRAALVGLNPDKKYLPFFYVSDLIDIILMNIQKELSSLEEALPRIKTDPALLREIETEQLNNRIISIKKSIQNFKRLRIVLGPVELKRLGAAKGNTVASRHAAGRANNAALLIPDTERTNFVNFGDLPISVSFFVEFLAQKVFKNDDSYYSLTRMLNDFFNTLIDKFLNSKDCFSFDISQKVRINQNVLTSYSPPPNHDEITALIQKKLMIMDGDGTTAGTFSGQPARLNLNDEVVKTTIYKDKKPILNISGLANEGSTYAPLSNEKNYLVFFAARTKPTERMTGKKSDDTPGGIFHYLLGRNKGIVKNIKLQKTQIKY